jgi:hypothetical protein
MRCCYPQSVRLLDGVYCGQNRVTRCIINEYTLRGLKASSGNVSVVVPVSWWSCCACLRVATSVFISCCTQPGPLTSQHYRQCRDIFRNSFLFYLTMIYQLSLKERMIINVAWETQNKKWLLWHILELSSDSTQKKKKKYEAWILSSYNFSL